MSTYQVIAKNHSEASENRIHSDDVARRYGFRGALVPGVAVYGYLTHPLVERFGERWLSESVNDVRFLKPAYDGDRLDIALDEGADPLTVTCTNQLGEHLATLTTRMSALPDIEPQSVFDGPRKPSGRVPMDWDNVVVGQVFPAWHWQITEDANDVVRRQVADELPIYRSAAHPHGLLQIANRALVREFVMPAWIHVGSEIRARAMPRVNDTLEIRAAVLDKWERKGHQFVKLYLTYLRDSEITIEVIHTAIFRVAE
jgi:acyl dehydratase